MNSQTAQQAPVWRDLDGDILIEDMSSKHICKASRILEMRIIRLNKELSRIFRNLEIAEEALENMYAELVDRDSQDTFKSLLHADFKRFSKTPLWDYYFQLHKDGVETPVSDLIEIATEANDEEG